MWSSGADGWYVRVIPRVDQQADDDGVEEVCGKEVDGINEAQCVEGCVEG